MNKLINVLCYPVMVVSLVLIFTGWGMLCFAGVGWKFIDKLEKDG